MDRPTVSPIHLSRRAVMPGANRAGPVGWQRRRGARLPGLQPHLLARIKSFEQIGPVVAQEFGVHFVAALDLGVADELVGRAKGFDDLPVDWQLLARVDRLHLVALVDALERAELPAGRGLEHPRDEAAILEGIEFDAVE